MYTQKTTEVLGGIIHPLKVPDLVIVYSDAYND